MNCWTCTSHFVLNIAFSYELISINQYLYKVFTCAYFIFPSSLTAFFLYTYIHVSHLVQELSRFRRETWGIIGPSIWLIFTRFPFPLSLCAASSLSELYNKKKGVNSIKTSFVYKTILLLSNYCEWIRLVAKTTLFLFFLS